MQNKDRAAFIVKFVHRVTFQSMLSVGITQIRCAWIVLTNKEQVAGSSLTYLVLIAYRIVPVDFMP